MRLALFGGSFDPFHVGHLAMIGAALEQRLADRVLLVPAGQNPHKPAVPTAAEHRLRMAELGIAGLVGVTVLDWEARRPGPSYTCETVERLAATHPEDELLVMLGADNLTEFFTWRRPERILALSRLLVFPRAGTPPDLPPAAAARATVVDGFAAPVSATEVRAQLAAGRLPRDLVPAAVLDYIVAQRLYRADRGGG